jgi:hypothetical protein
MTYDVQDKPLKAVISSSPLTFTVRVLPRELASRREPDLVQGKGRSHP